MDEIIRDDLPRCTAECFANKKGRCVALKYVTDAVCPFFKTKQQAGRIQGIKRKSGYGI